jgi:PadR family transcriptional regulator PadR
MFKEETYGYKLIKDIEPIMDISESTLYPILKRLQSSGCIVSRSAEHNGRLRKYYAITNDGRERIKEFLSDWNDIEKVYNYIREESKNG